MCSSRGVPVYRRCVLGSALFWISTCAGVTGQAQSNEGFGDLLREGFALHQQADYARALPLLQRALKMEPHDYYANLLVGIELLRTEKPMAALVYLREASRVKPGEDIPLDYMAEAEGSLHQYAAAAEASAQAVSVAPSSDEAVEEAAGFALERFRTLSRELRSTVPGLAAEQRLEALSHPVNDPERLRLLQSSASLDAHAPGIWKDLAQADEAQGRSVEARDDLARGGQSTAPAHGAALSNAKGLTWLRHGEGAIDAGQWTAASVALERALQSGGDSTYARYLLCWVYARRASDIVQLLESRQESDVVHRIRGDVLLRMKGDGKAAAVEYAAALQSRSGDPALLERLAEAELASGQTDEAVVSAQAALRQDPHRFSATQTLAEAALQERRYADAIPYLKELQDHDPENAGTQVELGTAFARTGDAAGAVRLLGAALRRGYPDQKGSLHALLGGALRKTGQEHQAVEAFASARDLSERYQQSSHAPPGNDE
jgi:tetratricopeptide (TPR) repeat protein